MFRKGIPFLDNIVHFDRPQKFTEDIVINSVIPNKLVTT